MDKNTQSKKSKSKKRFLTTQKVFSQGLCSADQMKHSCNKYKNLIKEMLTQKQEHGLTLNLACDKTIYEIMKAQTKFPLEAGEDLNMVYQIADDGSNINDCREIFYTKLYTCTPLIYQTLLNMCSPKEINGIPLNGTNQKAIIFNYTNFLDKKDFEKFYILPQFEAVVKPTLRYEVQKLIADSEANSDLNLGPINQETWYECYKESLLSNVFIVNYSTLLELLIKVQNIPNNIRFMRDVSLIIVDSPNILAHKETKTEYIADFDDLEGSFGNISLINDQNKSNINNSLNALSPLKRMSLKNIRRSTSKPQKNMLEKITELLNTFQKEFNFNLITTVYDYHRIEDLNYLNYKKKDHNFKIENQSRLLYLKLSRDHSIEFAFKPDDNQTKNKIYAIEPFHSYYDMKEHIFAFIINNEGNNYEFLAFTKKPLEEKIELLERMPFVHRKEVKGNAK